MQPPPWHIIETTGIYTRVQPYLGKKFALDDYESTEKVLQIVNEPIFPII